MSGVSGSKENNSALAGTGGDEDARLLLAPRLPE